MDRWHDAAVLRMPSDDEPKDVGDRDIPVAIYEELSALRRTPQFLAILAAPLMLLGVLALLQFLEGWR